MMDALRYASLLGSVLTGVLLLVRPRWGLPGLILLIPFMVYIVPRAPHGLNAETVLFVIALLGVLLHVRPVLPPFRFLAPFLAYYACVLFGFALLVASHGSQPGGSQTPLVLAETMKSDHWPSLFFLIAYALASDEVVQRWAMRCLVAVLLIFSVNGLVDFATGASAAGAGSLYRATGALAGNPNHLGGHLAAFAILPLMGAFRRESSVSTRVTLAAVYAFSIVVLVLTQSRGSWLGFLAGHAAWLFLTKRQLFAPAALIVVLLGSVGYSVSLLPSVISNRIDKTLTPGQQLYGRTFLGRFDPSISIRLANHQMGAEMFLDSPLWGHGYHSFHFLTNKYGMKYGVWKHQGTGVSPESILLTVAVDNGLIGLGILIWLSWVLLSTGARLTYGDDEARTLGIAFLCICAAIGAESLTQNALNKHQISLPFWLFAGITVRAFRDHVLARRLSREPVSGGVALASPVR